MFDPERVLVQNGTPYVDSAIYLSDFRIAV
jgi:hypothetical protein